MEKHEEKHKIFTNGKTYSNYQRFPNIFFSNEMIRYIYSLTGFFIRINKRLTSLITLLRSAIVLGIQRI